MLPTFFVSHGAPTLVVQRSAAHNFLKTLPSLTAKPKAVLVISAHWEERAVTLGTGTGTIHDFYGFPEALYRLAYDAPAAPEVAVRTAALLEKAGIASTSDGERGRDHGAWVPLMLAWPKADIPVLQLSLIKGGDPKAHFDIGRALKPLRDEGVLIIGSGSATHNLRLLANAGGPAPWALAFTAWLDQTLFAMDDNALLKWETLAPQFQTNHPTSEHFDPIFVARGAAAGESANIVHSSWEFGSLSMNTYKFGG